ncbi:MAG: hypothetical protein M1470_13295 [Bacteroidetes bacterium]|nr:hypothetical protein [Bacteroidota bacterium]
MSKKTEGQLRSYQTGTPYPWHSGQAGLSNGKRMLEQNNAIKILLCVNRI